ncbi:hypothetical protein BJF78_34705 [Pseudonocardia sp. CNS-139]|nr:hypothetical protein BJF78_34705 [Pseudonocardia sp. CNS-139]
MVCDPTDLPPLRDDQGRLLDYTEEHRDRAVAKLTALASRLGFREYRDGLLFLDTATVEFPEAFQRVVQQFPG